MEKTNSQEQNPHPIPTENLRVEDVRFFAVGHGRSGTTWLERTLNSHPEILCKGSGMFFGKGLDSLGGNRILHEALANSEGVRAWHGSGKLNHWTKSGDFDQDVAQMMRAMIDSLMRRELTRSGKRVLGDRTPHYVSYLHEVYALYPEAKIIHAVRDGRDTAISGIHNLWHHSQDRGGHINLEPEETKLRDAYFEDQEAFLSSGQSIFTEKRIRQRARNWNRLVGQGRRTGMELFGDNYLDFRYEDHLHRSHEALQKLFGFLEVDTDPQIIGKAIESNSFEKLTGRSPGQELPSDHARKGVSGDWKELFTARDRRIFDEEAGELLAELGYEREAD